MSTARSGPPGSMMYVDPFDPLCLSRAGQAEAQVEEERRRSGRLAARLGELGIEPDCPLAARSPGPVSVAVELKSIGSVD